MAETVEQTAETDRAKRKIRVGKVVSNKMEKTAVVTIERLVKDQDYGRYVRRRKKFVVHDENNDCQEGDTIRFMETRPLSKFKRWRLVEIVERAK